MALAAARHAAQDRHLAPGDAGEPSALYGFTNNFAAYDVQQDSPGTRPVSKKLLKIICDRTLTGPDYQETIQAVAALRRRV